MRNSALRRTHTPCDCMPKLLRTQRLPCSRACLKISSFSRARSLTPVRRSAPRRSASRSLVSAYAFSSDPILNPKPYMKRVPCRRACLKISSFSRTR